MLEAPTSTIFWATAEGELRTPALDTGILASITRDRILGEVEVVEGEFPLSDVLGASEAFLASTVREAQPVSAVDGAELPQTPGPRTREAAEAFAGVLEREMGSTPARG